MYLCRISAASVSSGGGRFPAFFSGTGGGAMSGFLCCLDEEYVGMSGRIARGPVGIEYAPSWLPFECECPFRDAPFVLPSDAPLLFCASSTSFCRFSSAIRSRSAFERNFGFAAAASFSRFAFSMSSILGGCLFCEAHPFFTFFGCTNDGPSSSSGGGGGGGGASVGGGGGMFSVGGGGGGIVSIIIVVLRKVRWVVDSIANLFDVHAVSTSR